MAKTFKPIPQKTLDLYERLIAILPSIKRKGATMPYTSYQGNMFTFLGESGLGIRLPAKEREAFLKKHKTTLYKAHGVVLKEYVTVPNALLKDSQKLEAYFLASYKYAKSLKPKATKRK